MWLRSVQLDIKNKKKMTPFLEAVSLGYLGMTHKLIALGASINAVDGEGNSCLHITVRTEVFNSEDAPLDLLNECCTALNLKMEKRLSGMVVARYLASQGADFHHKNNNNNTPLDLIKDPNLRKKLETFSPPQCVFCEDVVATETFFPCKHLSLCKKCCLPKIPKQCLKCGRNITSKNSLVGPNSSKMEVQMVAGPVGSPELKEKDLLRVAKTLGRDWWQVEVNTTELKIDDESIDAVKQGYLMLYECFKNCDPETRTHATLSAALEEAECFAAMECLSLDAK
ncbi:E3 ubiquitin-protein ligase MIB2-like isoform X2 [Octopus sinensis]|uniref:E3 ubiquitin-protein ligase MIB2-like isoform X2 n=1 Tax=Octopus sinensis TaxID=2607531 RepID=A0A6P7SDY7_9MOLL|nr:E3 ubiquitin-protein ligase MIB2-like isoform X2 [Octopus sinensis]